MDGTDLRAQRRQWGLTQEQVATFLGVARPFVAEMEAGRRPIPAHQEDEIVSLFHALREGDPEVHQIRRAPRGPYRERVGWTPGTPYAHVHVRQSDRPRVEEAFRQARLGIDHSRWIPHEENRPQLARHLDLFLLVYAIDPPEKLATTDISYVIEDALAEAEIEGVVSGRHVRGGHRMAAWDGVARPGPARHVEVERASGGIETLFGKRLAAAEALRDFGLEIARPWGGRPLDGPADSILAALFARSSNTNWAALELCRIGFGPQAEMLERSLFEDMVDAHWVTFEPQVAAERYEQHREHGLMIFSDAVQQHADYFEGVELPMVDQGGREELNARFGSYGEKSWTGLNLYQRVYAIEHLWPDEGARRHLHFFRRIVHRTNNQQLHVSAQALDEIVRHNTAEGLSFRSGPSADRINTALFGSLWIMRQILGLVLRHFEFPERALERLDNVFADSAANFRELSEDELHGVGRNDPCPCGSGRKFKRCHGA